MIKYDIQEIKRKQINQEQIWQKRIKQGKLKCRNSPFVIMRAVLDIKCETKRKIAHRSSINSCDQFRKMHS